jgi:hypothetical protein
MVERNDRIVYLHVDFTISILHKYLYCILTGFTSLKQFIYSLSRPDFQGRSIRLKPINIQAHEYNYWILAWSMKAANEVRPDTYHVLLPLLL